jgi:hypothetical protein
VSVPKRFHAGVVFLSFAFASGAYCEPNPTLPDANKIVALREAVPGMNDATDADSVADLFAPMQMRVIGAGDDTWKRGNPNWSPVLNLIHNDLKKDIGPALTSQAAESAIRWDRELAAHLSAAQVNQLLAFYRSDVGRRYLAFQKRLMTVQVQANNALVGGMASGGMDPKDVAATPPSAVQLEARRKLVSLSWITQVTPALGVALSPSGGASISNDKAIAEMMIDSVATLRGPEIDALSDQYKSELPTFSAFQESPAARALIAVYSSLAKVAASERVNAGTGFMTALQESVAKHTPAWKTAYAAGRQPQAK